MSIESKLAAFSKSVVEEAVRAAGGYLKNLDENIAEEERMAAEKARLEMDDALSESAAKLTERQNRTVLSAEKEARKEILDLRLKLTEELFKDVTAMITDNFLSDKASGRKAYLDGLSADVLETVGAYPSASGLTLTARDHRALSGRLPESLEVTEDDSILGGFTLTVRKDNIAVEYTLSSALDKERAEFKGLITF